MQHLHRGLLDHSRHDDTDAVADFTLGLLIERGANFFREYLHERIRIDRGGKARHTSDGLAEEIREHEVRLARANVHCDDNAAPGFDIQEGRLATAHGLARGSFEDELLFEQFVDDDADGAAANTHGACEVGTGNRLMRAHEIQRDPAIDVAGCALRRHSELAGVDSPHFVTS